jgi:hypothetical protein
MSKDMEWAKAVARLFRGLYEDDMIRQAEASIEEVTASANVPMPNTTHPAYAGIRINPGQASSIRLRQPRTPKITSYTEKTAPDATDLLSANHVLVRKRCWGPAPFVGDPIWEMGGYTWCVWVDELGRHIAGDAELRIDQRSVPIRDIMEH